MLRVGERPLEQGGECLRLEHGRVRDENGVHYPATTQLEPSEYWSFWFAAASET
jgi:hypothetical protein